MKNLFNVPFLVLALSAIPGFANDVQPQQTNSEEEGAFNLQLHQMITETPFVGGNLETERFCLTENGATKCVDMPRVEFAGCRKCHLAADGKSVTCEEPTMDCESINYNE